MTKRELVSAISAQTGEENQTTALILETFIEVVMEAVANDDSVTLRRFGVFERKHHPKRPVRDVFNKVAVELPAHNAPRFRPAKEFKRQVQEQTQTA